jgi:hypothetical protein
MKARSFFGPFLLPPRDAVPSAPPDTDPRHAVCFAIPESATHFGPRNRHQVPVQFLSRRVISDASSTRLLFARFSMRNERKAIDSRIATKQVAKLRQIRYSALSKKAGLVWVGPSSSVQRKLCSLHRCRWQHA